MLQKLFNALSGRTTAFCGSFFVAGNVFHYFHRLDGTYIAFMTALLGIIVGHSVKEDIFGKKDAAKIQEA
jgi:hypothetical protein